MTVKDIRELIIKDIGELTIKYNRGLTVKNIGKLIGHSQDDNVLVRREHNYNSFWEYPEPTPVYQD